LRLLSIFLRLWQPAYIVNCRVSLARLGLFDSIFGKKHNVERGKEVEQDFKAQREIMGEKVERTGIGSDYKITHPANPILGRRKRSEYWDTKRNDSPVSERQKQTRGLKIYRHYDPSPERPLGETRIENTNGDKLEYDYLKGNYVKAKKQNNDFFSYGSSTPRKRKSNSWDPFGSGSSSRRRNDDLLGGFSADNMFGGGSSGRRRKRKNDLWGF